MNGMETAGNVIRVLINVLACMVLATQLAGCNENPDTFNQEAHARETLNREALPVNPRLGGDFSMPSTKLEDGRVGKPLALSHFKGKVVLLNFGYTECPDICPMVLSRMAQVVDNVKRVEQSTTPNPTSSASPSLSDQLQGVFVTFDPERDTLTKLKDYLAFFNQDFVGFSGSINETRQAAKQYGVVFMPVKDDVLDKTLFSHSDFIYLLDREQRVRALYATDTPLDKIVSDVMSLLHD